MKNKTFSYHLPGVDHLSTCNGECKIIQGSKRTVAVCVDLEGTGAQNAKNFLQNLKKSVPDISDIPIILFYPHNKAWGNTDYCVVVTADSTDNEIWSPVTLKAVTDFIGCSEDALK